MPDYFKIEYLKSKNISLHVIASGGAATLQNALWIPGSSQFLNGCEFPYSREAKAEILGFTSDKEVCEENAIDLACAAYMKAYHGIGGKEPVGVGITCHVASDHDANRFHWCIIAQSGIHGGNVKLRSGKDREYLESVITGYMASAIPCLCNGFDADFTGLTMARILNRPYFHSNGSRLTLFRTGTNANPARPALYPGSFNPAHEGHLGIINHMRNKYHLNTTPMITVKHPSKGDLSPQDILKRVKGLKGVGCLIDEKNSLFIEKARAYPNTPFVLGSDSLDTLLDPKWGPVPSEMLYEFSSLGTTFFVSPRNGLTVDDIFSKRKIPLVFRMMFTEIDYSSDRSSTEIRNALHA